MWIMFGFVFGVPSCFWLMTQCVGMQGLLMVDWICLYGYSMVPYLMATLLCLIPIHIFIWTILAIATAMSALLVVRNVATPLLASDTNNSLAGPILLAILAAHAIFYFVLKLTFYE